MHCVSLPGVYFSASWPFEKLLSPLCICYASARRLLLAQLLHLRTRIPETSKGSFGGGVIVWGWYLLSMTNRIRRKDGAFPKEKGAHPCKSTYLWYELYLQKVFVCLFHFQSSLTGACAYAYASPSLTTSSFVHPPFIAYS